NEAQGRLRRQRPAVDLAMIDSEQESMSEVISFPLASPDADPERIAAQREVRRLMEQAIAGLPAAFRLGFLMRVVEEMSSEQTASSVGVREETSKTRLHRARKLVRRALDEQPAPALKDSFPFDGARCARIADVVLKRIGLTDQ